MANLKSFLLPDLGEGLPDATVVEWFVKVGEIARLDEPLVAMETAKAVVEVPAPCSGVLRRIAGGPGSVVVTNTLLAEFELDASLPQRAEGHDSGHHHGAPEPGRAGFDPPVAAAVATQADTDAGTVVGAMTASSELRAETSIASGGIKAMPAVRALAKKLGVDLARIAASGPDGAVTMGDVKAAAAAGPVSQATPLRPAANVAVAASVPVPATTSAEVRPMAASTPAVGRTALSTSGKPLRTQPPGVSLSGQPEPLTGVRRNMARVMADAHAKVVPTTLTDDADIDAWLPGNDITVRLLRALVRGCRAEPALNAWLDGDTLTRTLHPQVDVGLAVDTPDGLFVPALRNADVLDANGLREAVNRLSTQVQARALPASELTGYTISLSNFGKYSGRYATPVVVPPCVAIVAAGRGRHQVVPTMGGIATHRIIPLSLTFDHRACTGGEAARFLRAMLDDLGLPT